MFLKESRVPSLPGEVGAAVRAGTWWGGPGGRNELACQAQPEPFSRAQRGKGGEAKETEWGGGGGASASTSRHSSFTLRPPGPPSAEPGPPLRTSGTISPGRSAHPRSSLLDSPAGHASHLHWAMGPFSWASHCGLGDRPLPARWVSTLSPACLPHHVLWLPRLPCGHLPLLELGLCSGFPVRRSTPTSPGVKHTRGSLSLIFYTEKHIAKLTQLLEP